MSRAIRFTQFLFISSIIVHITVSNIQGSYEFKRCTNHNLQMYVRRSGFHKTVTLGFVANRVHFISLSCGHKSVIFHGFVDGSLH